MSSGVDLRDNILRYQIALGDCFLRPKLVAQSLFRLGRWVECFQLGDDVSDLCLVARVVSESDAELLAQILEQVDREVAVLVQATRGPAERAF